MPTRAKKDAHPAPSQPDHVPTEYEDRLYKLCKKIPAGKVTTFGALSEVLDTAPRAVGRALSRNPFGSEVPCHRIVSANLDIGSYFGGRGATDPKVQQKQKLLEEEGVHFNGSVVNDPKRVLGPDELRRLM